MVVHSGMRRGVSWGRTMSAVAILPDSFSASGRASARAGRALLCACDARLRVMRAFCKAFTARPRYLPRSVIFGYEGGIVVCKDPAIMKILEEGVTLTWLSLVVRSATEIISLNLRHLGEERNGLLTEPSVTLSLYERSRFQAQRRALSAFPWNICVLVLCGWLSWAETLMRALDTALRMGIRRILWWIRTWRPRCWICVKYDVMKVGDGARR